MIRLSPLVTGIRCQCAGAFCDCFVVTVGRLAGAFCDLVWSDPEDVVTWSTSPRGAGWLFGANVTHEFMEENRLDLICRAHQLVHEGKAAVDCADCVQP